MFRKNFVVAIGLAETLITLGAAAADSPSSIEVAQRLERAADTSAAATSQLLRVVESNPRTFPPDPCRDQSSAACRSVRALGAIAGDAESLLGGVETLDDGDDRRALRRRLSRGSETMASAQSRLGAMTADWLNSGSPPDPCTPAVEEKLDGLGTSAESASQLAGELDTCSNPPSVLRRLGHVSESLRAANSRLETLTINPPEPDDPTDAEIQAIVASAKRIVALAESLKSEAAPLALDYRGLDAFAGIDANGGVTLRATTVWQPPIDFAPSGVDSARFGVSEFSCPDSGNVSVPRASGLQVVSVNTGLVVYSAPANSFTLDLTTAGSTSSNRREQVLPIPFGSSAMTGQIVAPLNLPFGDYDIIWTDWGRVSGIQNLLMSTDCPSLAAPFGFSVRVRWNGQPNHGPAFSASSNPQVVQGVEFSLDIDASDADDDPFVYSLVPLNPAAPVFGPAEAVPGLSVSVSGTLSIAAETTAALLENADNVTGADYLLRVKMTDSHGATSEFDRLLDVQSSVK